MTSKFSLTLLTFLSCFALGCFFQSCTKEPGTQLVKVDIEKEFVISATETLSKQGSGITFQIETNQLQSPTDTTIDCFLIIENKKLKLLLNGVVKGAGSGAPATKKAKALLSTGALAGGFYDVEISLLNSTITNKGLLTVTDDQYSFSFSTSDGFELPQREIPKTPPSLIWGFAAYNDGAGSVLAKDFVEQIKTWSQDAGAVKPKKYTFFDASRGLSNLEIFTNSLLAPVERVSFVRFYDKNLTALEDFVKSYRAAYPSVYVAMYASDGTQW